MKPEFGVYVHGYEATEAARLSDQASALESALHDTVRYPKNSLVLEVGCGTGAQTINLCRNSPGAQFVAFDKSGGSLAAANARAVSAGLVNVRFVEADLFDLPFESASFDHVYICFVLEHLQEPLKALLELRRYLRPGGTVTLIEGDHGSSLFYPDSAAARAAIEALANLQRAAGGDPNIGRRLYPLLTDAGFTSIEIEPVQIYVDGSRPEAADAFTRRTFTAMVEGVRGRVIEAGLIEADDFEAGVRALQRTAEPDGIFSYTFFRGLACAP